VDRLTVGSDSTAMIALAFALALALAFALAFALASVAFAVVAVAASSVPAATVTVVHGRLDTLELCLCLSTELVVLGLAQVKVLATLMETLAYDGTHATDVTRDAPVDLVAGAEARLISAITLCTFADDGDDGAGCLRRVVDLEERRVCLFEGLAMLACGAQIEVLHDGRLVAHSRDGAVGRRGPVGTRKRGT